MKRYKKYKPSGIEWIGEIPEHWKIIRLKYLSKIENGSTPNTGVVEYWNGKIRWATPVDVSNAKNYLISDTGKKITKEGFDSCGTTLVEPSSIILTTRAPIGNVAMAGDYICTNQGCKAIHLLKANHTYLFYQLLVSKGVLESLGSGSTFKELSTDALKSFLVCLPSNNEQTVIADYLDSKTAQIDDSIVKKQKLIDLLNEEKTAIINQTVTKGLNPDAPLKDSGVLWLGEIPEHWEVEKLKYIAETIQTGSTPPTENTEYYLPEISWFTPVDFSDDLMLSDSKRKISTLAVEEGAAKLFKENSVLLVGIGATLGKVGLISGPASANQQINVITFDSKLLAKYYLFLLFVNQKNIAALSNSATLAILNQTQTKDVIVPLPDLTEIKEIVGHVEKDIMRIKTTIRRVDHEIELLREYRTALISEAVTGKIDVRI